MDAGGHPEHHKIVEQVGALAHHGVGMAVHGIDHHFDRFLRKLLGHLAAARAQQPRSPRRCRIGGARGQHGLIEAIERITHSGSGYRQPPASGLMNMACYSSLASSEALPPAAAVLTVTTCSAANRSR